MSNRYDVVVLTRETKTARDEAIRALSAIRSSTSSIAISVANAQGAAADVAARQTQIEKLLAESIPAHQWLGSRLRLMSPDGQWGTYVELRGPAGTPGERGAKGDKGDRGEKGDKGDKGDPGTGNGDMVALVYDPNNDGKVAAADTADAVPWSGVTGKPSSFTPSAHSHVMSEITGLPGALASKADAAATQAALNGKQDAITGIFGGYF